ncbi:MAG: hypothetical protein IT285_06025 [Bdellovibrionales bacterium]|nr:hypothetical protein [Bdellovibrionales bacterium]
MKSTFKVSVSSLHLARYIVLTFSLPLAQIAMSAWAARAEEPVIQFNSGLDFGLSQAISAGEGPIEGATESTVTVHAEILAHKLILVSGHGSVDAGAGSTTEGDFTTSVDFDAGGFVGGTPLDDRKNGCSGYGGVGGEASGGAHLNIDGLTGVSAIGAAEAGLVCRVDDVLFMVGPALGAGTAVRLAEAAEGGELGTDGNLLRVGGQFRLAIQGTGTVAAWAFHGPDLGEGGVVSTQAALAAHLKVTDEIEVGGYGRFIDLRGEGQALTGGEFGASAGFAF